MKSRRRSQSKFQRQAGSQNAQVRPGGGGDVWRSGTGLSIGRLVVGGRLSMARIRMVFAGQSERRAMESRESRVVAAVLMLREAGKE